LSKKVTTRNIIKEKILKNEKNNNKKIPDFTYAIQIIKKPLSHEKNEIIAKNFSPKQMNYKS